MILHLLNPPLYEFYPSSELWGWGLPLPFEHVWWVKRKEILELKEAMFILGRQRIYFNITFNFNSSIAALYH